jgi:general secretion pathway protein F
MDDRPRDNTNGPPLSDQDAIVLAEVVADVAAVGMPLASGMRAAAEESSSRRLSGALQHLAGQIESGRPIDEILADEQGRFGSTIGRLVRAAVRTGATSEALIELVDWQRTRRELWRSMIASILYPAILVVLTILLIAFYEFVLVGPAIEIFMDMEIRPPPVTQLMIWFHSGGTWWLLGLALGLTAAALAFRLAAGAARWRRVLYSIPLFGPLWHWIAVAEWTRLLAILTRHGIALPAALRLAADSVHDASVAESSLCLAADIEQGRALPDRTEADRHLPPSLAPIFRWGEESGHLHQAFAQAAEMYSGRAQLRCDMLRSIVPPLVFIGIATVALLLLAGLYAPMIKLIDSLSWSWQTDEPATPDWNPVNYLGFLFIGAALLWSVRLIYGVRMVTSDDLVKRLLLLAAWILMLAGCLGVVIGLTGPFAILPLFALLIIAFAYMKYMEAERRALLWALALAAERGIPIEHAARAFAKERSIQLGTRARYLADLLQSGVPLPNALVLSRNPVPADALLAARLGAATGSTGAALRMSVDFGDSLDAIMRGTIARYFYITALVTAAMCVVTFLMLKIVPVMVRMFSEFELDLPASTELYITLADFFVNYWPLFLPAYGLVLLMILLGISYYVAWSRYELPGFRRIWLRRDSALVLRGLALAVRQKRELGPTVSMLSAQYPKASVGKRLGRAAEDIRDGRHWCDALHTVRVLRAADVAVLKSAERVGNLEWALEEMSDSTLRRFAIVFQAVLNTVFPVVIIGFGLFVLFTVLAMFLPLVSLILGLS